MKFASPEWLYLLPLVLALFALNRYLLSRSKKRIENFVQSNLWNIVLPQLNWSAKSKNALFGIFSIGFILLSLARPQWGKIEEDVRITGLDILFVLDLSQSMNAEDVLPSRLSKAKHFIRSVLDRVGNDRVGIIGFAGTAFLASPLTTDTGYVREILETLDPTSIQNQGTDIALALETAKRAFERGAESSSSGAADSAASQVLVLLSDGESHEAAADRIAADLGKSGVRVLVTGVGTEQGGPIPIRDARGELQGHKRDSSNQPVVSRFNGAALRQLSQQAGGLYWDMSPGGMEADEMADEINRLQRTDLGEQKRTVYHERFQWPLAIAVLLFLMQLLFTEKTTRKSRTALILLPLLFAQPSEAARLQSYLENNKGVQAREEGKLQEAIQHFGNAQAVDPESPELLYNQGTIQLDQKNIPDAIVGFEKSAESALQRGNPGLAGRSLFNQGTAHQLDGKMESAIQSYLRTIEAARSAKDTELEEAARKRLQSIAEKMNQPEQKKGSQSDPKNQESNSKGDDPSPDKTEPENDPSKNDPKNEDPKKFEDPGKQDRKNQFESQQMSEEDAEKVMSELAGRERELQKKFQRQGVRQKTSDKDW